MVGRVSRAGVRDWLVQRITALILGIYTVFIIIYLVAQPALTYEIWHNLYSNIFMKLATLIVVLSILWHAWVGLWTVFTDYVKSKAVRILLEAIVLILLTLYVIWTVLLLWL